MQLHMLQMTSLFKGGERMMKKRKRSQYKSKNRASISKVNELDFLDLTPRWEEEALKQEQEQAQEREQELELEFASQPSYAAQSEDAKLLLERKSEQNAAVIYTSDIVDQAITTEKLANGAVDESKIKRHTIGTHTIKDRAITSAKLADHSVTAHKIAPSSVNEAHLNKAIITEDHIQDQAIVT